MNRVLFFLSALLSISCNDSSRGIEFKKEDYGNKWPFRVNKIDVFCTGIANNEVYFTADNDTTYALNGEARLAAENRTSGETFNDAEEVILNDKQYGGKMAVPSEFISKALEQCNK
jgi:hypothetical protein